MNGIDKLVCECFTCNIDYIRPWEILIEFIEMIEDDFCKTGVRSIASGELGLCLHNYGIPVDVLVQGGLRNGKQILNLKDKMTAAEFE